MKIKQIQITVKDDATQEDIDAFVDFVSILSDVYKFDAVVVYTEIDTDEPTQLMHYDDTGKLVVMGTVHE